MKNKRATKLISLIIAFALIFALLPFSAVTSLKLYAANAPHYNPNVHSFDAPSQETPAFTSKNISLTNANFSTSVNVFSSNYASGWTQSGSASNAVTGTLDTTNYDTFISKQFTDNKDIPFMSVNPSSSTSGNQNVLVIANKSTASTAAINYSQSVGEFYADGFFEVMVDFYAVGGDKNPSAVYLIPSTEFSESARPIPSVSVKQAYTTGMAENTSVWQTARFLVKTDARENINFTLSLNLGTRSSSGTLIAGSGVVYYDNVRVTAYNESKFKPIWDTAESDKAAVNPSFEQSKSARNTCLVDLTKPYDKATPVAKTALDPENSISKYNENFNSSTTNFNITSDTVQGSKTRVQPYTLFGNIAANLNLKEVASVYNNTSPNNSGAMLLSAVDSRAGVRYKNPLNQSNSLKINRHSIYMISFYTLATDSAYFRIYDTRVGTKLPDYIEPYDSGYMQIGRNQTSAAASRNSWILNTVFVTGEVLNDINVYFEFWVGGENNGTGYLLVDDFSVVYVSEQYHNKYATGQNVTDLKLNKLNATADISNSYFNLGTNRSVTAPYPLIASDWSVYAEDVSVTDHAKEIRIINGIVNTDINHWASNNVEVKGATSGGKAYGAAVNPNDISYTGQGTNNNIYMMQNSQYTYQKVTSKSFGLGTDSNNIISFDAATYKLTNREVWAVIEVNGSEVTRLSLCDTGDVLGMRDWCNYTISIQTSKYTSPSCTLSFILGDANDKSMGCLFFDNISLTQNTSGVSDESVNFSDPSKLYRKNSRDDGGQSLFFVPNNAETASSYYWKASDVLAISTNGPSYAVVENNMTETLTTDKWYLYKVSVSTASVRMEEMYYDKDEKPDWGISLKLKGMEGGYEYLQNADIEEMPSYLNLINGKQVKCIDFNFAIKPGSSFDLALVIEFGSESQPVTGSLGIVGTSLTEIEKDAYDTYKKDSFARVITTAQKEDSSDESSGSGIKFDWLVVPSIIMGLAIIVAVGGTIIRRMNFRKHIVKQHTSYARDDAAPIKKTPTAKKSTKEKA